MRMSGKNVRFYPLLALVLLLPAGAAGGLEINADLRLENLGFTTTRTSTDTSFPGADLFWNGSLSLVQDIADNFSVEGGYYRDLILRNVVYTQARYTSDYLSLGIGTIVGVFNTAETPVKTGISTTMRLELPGAVFVSVRSEASMANDISANGDYSMERTDITLGFMVQDALCSLGLNSRKLTAMVGGLETVDSLSDYSFKIVVFEKNVPLRLHFLFSYQDLRKTFKNGANNPSAAVASFIAGLGLDLELGRSFSLTAGASASLYSLGSGLLANVSVLGFATPLLSVDAGFTLKLQPPSRPPAS